MARSPFRAARTAASSAVVAVSAHPARAAVGQVRAAAGFRLPPGITPRPTRGPRAGAAGAAAPAPAPPPPPARPPRPSPRPRRGARPALARPRARPPGTARLGRRGPGVAVALARLFQEARDQRRQRADLLGPVPDVA